jgi:hypothetical protein
MLTTAAGSKTRQPNHMSWSYRMRGRVARTQIYMNKKNATFTRNQKTPINSTQG